MNRRHILLLDPNGGNRRNLGFLLQLTGYQVTEVAAEDEALNRLAHCGDSHPFDLLLICQDQPGAHPWGGLSGLQQKQLSLLLVTDPPDNHFKPQRAEIPLQSCRRNEIIETLARFWAIPQNQADQVNELQERPDEQPEVAQ